MPCKATLGLNAQAHIPRRDDVQENGEPRRMNSARAHRSTDSPRTASYNEKYDKRSERSSYGDETIVKERRKKIPDQD